MSISGPIVISSDEINCLIYAYFQDAGFNHSAFALRNEGRLQHSPYFSKHIPRGELIELLTKSLLYMEVESHWKGNELMTNCKIGFSLLEHHVCSLEEPQAKSTIVEEPTGNGNASALPNSATGPQSSTLSHTKDGLDGKVAIRNGPAAPSDIPVHEQVLQKQRQALAPSVENAKAKRKTSPVPTDEGHSEKKQRRGSTDMEVDTTVSANPDGWQKSPTGASNTYDAFTGQKLIPKAFIRPQGPGDQTDSRVALMLNGHKSEVFVCAFNPKKHNILASGSKDSVVYLWDLPDPPTENFADSPGEPVVVEQINKAENGDLTSLGWNPDGTLLAIGSYDSVLRVCTLDGSIYFSHPQHEGPIFATRFSKGGIWLLSASLDGTACLWHVKEKRLHRQYRFHKGGYCCLDVEWLSEDMFATAGADQRLFIHSVNDDRPVRMLSGHKDEINQIRVNSAGTRLASCSDDGTAYVWRVDNLRHEIPGLTVPDPVVILKGHTHSVSTVGWCVDRPAGTNELIATSSFDGTARLWDSVTGECYHVFKDHKRPLYSLKFSPDGRFIATGSGDGWLHIYHTRTHHRLFSWFASTEKPGVFEIDWQTHDGINRIALALECREVAVLDTTKIDVFAKLIQATGEQRPDIRTENTLLTQVLVPPHLHTAVLFTPAGELIASAVQPSRSKDEIRILVGITGEVWQETREQGYGMVESDLGRIIVLPVDDVDLNGEQVFSQTRQPFLLLVLNATDAVEWEELDSKGRMLAQHVSKPLSKFRELLVSPRSLPSTTTTSPAPLRV